MLLSCCCWGMKKCCNMTKYCPDRTLSFCSKRHFVYSDVPKQRLLFSNAIPNSCLFTSYFHQKQVYITERGGSVVTHETRIQEVRVLIPVPSNLTGVFSWFSSIIKADAELDFHYHDPFDHYSSNSYITKLKSVNLTNETLTTQQ